MNLRTLMQVGPTKANELFARLAETSDGAVKWGLDHCRAKRRPLPQVGDRGAQTRRSNHLLQCRPACTAAYAGVCAVEYAVALRWRRDGGQVAACPCSHAPSTSLARFVSATPSRAANAIPAKSRRIGSGGRAAPISAAASIEAKSA